MKFLVFLALLVPAVLSATCPYQGCWCGGSTINCNGATVHLTSLPHRDVSKEGGQTTIRLERNDITAIGDGELSSGLVTLESWFTPFARIGDHAFNESASTMVRIILQHSNLTVLPQSLAELNSQFVYLDMTWAQISNISVLQKMQNSGLTFLKLTGNQISDHKAVEAGVNTLKSLANLYLGFNRLSQAPNISQARIYFLELDNNNISSIPAGTLGTTLSTAQFSNNNLTEVPADLTNCKGLWTLFLSGNQIKSIDNFYFPPVLTTMWLDNNNIEVLNSIRFSGATRLRWVQMFNNPLRVIAPDAFRYANQIKQLTLSNTQLTRLPLAVTQLPRIVMLYLNGVKGLQCTCDEAALGAYFVRRGGFNVGGECNGVTITYFLHEMAGQCPSG